MGHELGGQSGPTPLFPGLDEIPDPAAPIAARPAPPAEAPSEPSATRPQRARQGAVALAAALAWVCGMIAHYGLRQDLRDPPIVVALSLLAVFAAGAVWLILRPGARGLPLRVRGVQAAAIAIPLGFAALALLGSHTGVAPPPDHAWTCVSAGGAMTFGPLVLAAVMLRRSFLTAPAWRGAAAGALCSLLGAVGIHACCLYTAADHVLLEHALPILGGALLGAAAGAVKGRI